MLIKKTRTAAIYKIDNTIKKRFIATLNNESAHRLGPRHCVCGKPISITFKHEIHILEKLKQYKYFPTILDVKEDEYSFTMTYCGENLHDLIQNKTFKKPDNWKTQIEHISEALTEQNIYNNDISPTNVCIKNGCISLVDFGCVQPLDIKLEENYDGRNNMID